MTTEIKHSFEGQPIFRMLTTNINQPLDLDLTTVTDTAKTYLPTLYDGFVYVNGIPYQITGLIKVGFQKGISTNNSTLDDKSCLLCYGSWVLRNINGINFNTVDYIGQTVDIIWIKYHNGIPNEINIYPLPIVKGVDIRSLDMYISYNIADVVTYLNTNYSLTCDITRPLDVYLIISIDDYNGLLLHAGSNP